MHHVGMDIDATSPYIGHITALSSGYSDVQHVQDVQIVSVPNLF
jgi:hypothetical protein